MRFALSHALMLAVGVSMVDAPLLHAQQSMNSTPSRASTSARAAKPHVLVVISSAGRDSGRTQPGFEMDELSQAWLVFTANGMRVTIASPAGGAAQADKFDRASDYNARFLADTSAMRQLNNTRRTAGLAAADYDALFVVGGKGAMFDLPLDTALARLAGSIHDRGGVVSAVCHGPAGLVAALTRDGKPLLAGRAVTGFTDEEEIVFGKQWRPKYPWLLESHIRSLGARWEEAGLMLPHVVRDGRLVTGQNPYATPGTVEAVITAMGRTPVARTPWRDERTVRFASQALMLDPQVARRTLAESHKELQIDMIGLIGYYQLQASNEMQRTREALSLMELAAPYMPQPEISLGMADAYHRLGRAAEAKSLAAYVARQHPDRPDVKQLLSKLGN